MRDRTLVYREWRATKEVLRGRLIAEWEGCPGARGMGWIVFLLLLAGVAARSLVLD